MTRVQHVLSGFQQISGSSLRASFQEYLFHGVAVVLTHQKFNMAAKYNFWIKYIIHNLGK